MTETNAQHMPANLETRMCCAWHMPTTSPSSHVLCIEHACQVSKLACAMHSTCETETWPGMGYAF